MPESPPAPKPKAQDSADRLVSTVARREARMIRGKKQSNSDTVRALALIGLIGWSVVLPMLIGVAIGAWIDHRWRGRFSWTLILLLIGLAAGCWNAWKRISEEQGDR